MNEFSVGAPEFATALSKVKGAIGKRDGIQALTYILFKVNSEEVEITSYNQSISARAVIPTVDFAGNPFAFAADGKFLLNLASSVKGDRLSFKFQPQDTAKSGANSSFYGTLASGSAEWTTLCIPETSYPLVRVNDPVEWTIKRSDLEEVLENVSPAVSDVMKTLGDATDAIRQVNSYGLHWRNGRIESGGGGRYMIGSVPGLDKVRFDFVMPPEGATILLNMCRVSDVEDVVFGLVDDREVNFSFGKDRLGIFTVQNLWLDTSNKLEIPVDTSATDIFEVDKVLFKGAISQVQFLSDGDHGIRLRRDGENLLVYADDQIGQKGQVSLRVKWKTEDDYEVGFNWVYLRDFATSFGGGGRTITFKRGSVANGRAVLYLHHGNLKGYILPLRTPMAVGR